MQLSGITPEMIDYMLRSGSNEPDSVIRIVGQFQKHSDIAENADFLRREFIGRHYYHNCRGYEFESADGLTGGKVSAVFEKTGITLGTKSAAGEYKRLRHSYIKVYRKESSIFSDIY